MLYIHRYLVDKFPELRSAASTTTSFKLLDVSGETGHVIVHYLYTKKYDSIVAAPGSDALRRSFEVYAAATKFQLDGLRKKVQEAIEAQTSGIDAAEALALLKMTYPLPDSDDVWLRAYTETLANVAYTDVSSFLASDFMAPQNTEAKISVTEMILRAVMARAKERELRAIEVSRQQPKVPCRMFNFK